MAIVAFILTGCGLFADLDNVRGEDPGLVVDISASQIPVRTDDGDLEARLTFDFECEPAGCEFISCTLRHESDDTPRERSCDRPLVEQVSIEGEWIFAAKAIANDFPRLEEASVDVSFTPFETRWDTSHESSHTSQTNQVRLPLVESGEYHFLVDWGDGTEEEITDWDQAEVLHAYSAPGEYTIRIVGVIQGWSFGESDGDGDAVKLTEITRWGSLRLGGEAAHFQGATNLRITASDIPDLSATTSLSSTFERCSSLDDIPSIQEWDVSHIRDMSSMFRAAASFTGDIRDWDVSNVTDMSSMFRGAHDFNRGIGAWDVSSVTDMSFMFFNAESFNRELGDWDVSSVTNMNSMFRSSAFDQPIGDWNVFGVTDMDSMFSFSDFDQDIGNWDVSNVTNLTDMFTAAGLSVDNYDSLLNGWAGRDVESNLEFHAGDSQFSLDGQQARETLTDVHGWTIHDAGGPLE